MTKSILNKIHIQAGDIELRLVVSFHEVATGIAKDCWLNYDNAVYRSLDEVEFRHSSLGIRI